MTNSEEFWDSCRKKSVKKTGRRFYPDIEHDEARKALTPRSRCVEFSGVASLLGSIYKVGNVHLDIPPENQLRHPCVITGPNGNDAFAMSRGRDASKIRDCYKSQYVVVRPDGTNGLTKETGFYCKVDRVRCRDIYQNDFMGSLSREDLDRLVSLIRRVSASS